MNMDLDVYNSLIFKEIKKEEYAENIIEAAEIVSASMDHKNTEVEITWNEKRKLAAILKYGLETFYLMDFEHQYLVGEYDRKTGEQLKCGLSLDDCLQILASARKYLNTDSMKTVRMLLPQMLDIA